MPISAPRLFTADMVRSVPVAAFNVSIATPLTPVAVPVEVTLPAPTVGKVAFTNTFGEFETRLVLVQHLKDEATARRAAGGLDGDRYALINTPQGDAVAWATVWDSPVDAADFLDLMGDAARRRYEMGKPTIAPGATTRRFDIDATGTHGVRTVTLEMKQVDGRAMVFFLDLSSRRGCSD